MIRLGCTVSLALSLLACGGGGGGGDSSPAGGGSLLTVLIASQQMADHLVDEINNYVKAKAAHVTVHVTGCDPADRAVCDVLTFIGGGDAVPAASIAEQACSESGTIKIDLLTPISSMITYSNCKASGYTYQGTVSASFPVNELVSIARNFSVTGPSGDPVVRSDLSQCKVAADGALCDSVEQFHITLTGDDPVTLSGTNATISSASATLPLPDSSSGTITVKFSDWNYDLLRGYATSGSATVRDGSGNTADVLVTGVDYAVTITVGTAERPFKVLR